MYKKLFIKNLQGFFYVFAGVNHFVNPGFYLPLIPEYLPRHAFINISAGIFEIMLGLGLFFKATRKVSGVFIIIMLMAFVPSHIHFIRIGSCVQEGLCVPVWIAWGRLLLVHPLLIFWAYTASRSEKVIARKI